MSGTAKRRVSTENRRGIPPSQRGEIFEIFGSTCAEIALVFGQYFKDFKDFSFQGGGGAKVQ